MLTVSPGECGVSLHCSYSQAHCPGVIVPVRVLTMVQTYLNIFDWTVKKKTYTKNGLICD